MTVFDTRSRYHMRRWALALAGGAALIVLAGSAEAQPTTGRAPWCVVVVRGGWLDCAYYSHAQCMATASGVSNQCTPNSWYVPPQPSPRSRKRGPRR